MSKIFTQYATFLFLIKTTTPPFINNSHQTIPCSTGVQQNAPRFAAESVPQLGGDAMLDLIDQYVYDSTLHRTQIKDEEAAKHNNYLFSSHYNQQPCNSTTNLNSYEPSASNFYYSTESSLYTAGTSQNTITNCQSENYSSEQNEIRFKHNNTTANKAQLDIIPAISKNSETNRILCYYTVHLLKNLLYYRFNIARVFILFTKQININNVKNNCDNKESAMLRFINLSIQFAINNKTKAEHNVVLIEESAHSQLKIYEKWVSDEIINMTSFELLKNSVAFKAIKKHNKSYLISLSIAISASRFQALYFFLKPFIYHKDILSKYYCMIINLIMSLYDVSKIINEKLDQNLQKYLQELCVFEVELCYCSNEDKNSFFFHWAYCWICYFSNICILPVIGQEESYVFFTINNYPKEFFIQLIFLIHTIINFESEKINEKDLDLAFIIGFKKEIHDLLFSRAHAKKKSIFQVTLKNLLGSILHVSNHEIYRLFSASNVKIIQTPKENYILSNELIPAIQKFVEVVFKLTKRSYQQTKLLRE